MRGGATGPVRDTQEPWFLPSGVTILSGTQPGTLVHMTALPKSLRNDNQHWLHLSYMPGAALNTLYVLIYLILITTLRYTISLFFNSYIEIIFTYHTSHPFKVHTSMDFSVFTDVFITVTINFRTFSISSKGNPVLFSYQLSSPLPPPLNRLTICIPIGEIRRAGHREIQEFPKAKVPESGGAGNQTEAVHRCGSRVHTLSPHQEDAREKKSEKHQWEGATW